MKTLLVAAAVLGLTSALSLSPAKAQTDTGASNGAAHYEWQYHYVGHHPRYEGHWVLVK